MIWEDKSVSSIFVKWLYSRDITSVTTRKRSWWQPLCMVVSTYLSISMPCGYAHWAGFLKFWNPHVPGTEGHKGSFRFAELKFYHNDNMVSLGCGSDGEKIYGVLQV